MSKPSDRRAFLKHSTGCAVLALAALGLPAREVFALPIEFITGSGGKDEKTYPVPAADGVQIDREAQVILVRFGGRIYAFSLACPHENAAVKWVAKDQRFQCTKHDSKYQPDGVYTSGRATRNMDRFPIRRDGTNVVVSIDRVFHSDLDGAAWSAASVPAA